MVDDEDDGVVEFSGAGQVAELGLVKGVADGDAEIGRRSVEGLVEGDGVAGAVAPKFLDDAVGGGEVGDVAPDGAALDMAVFGFDGAQDLGGGEA